VIPVSLLDSCLTYIGGRFIVFLLPVPAYNDDRSKNMSERTIGSISENLVKYHLEKLGLNAEKPKPDRGVDFSVWNKDKEKSVKIQVKGRSIQKTSDWNRWFQVRRNSTKTPQDKINQVDYFVLVSIKHSEIWLFTREEIRDIAEKLQWKYWTRKDNRNGLQRELNLDVPLDAKDGKLVREIYSSHCYISNDNFNKVRFETLEEDIYKLKADIRKLRIVFNKILDEN